MDQNIQREKAVFAASGLAKPDIRIQSLQKVMELAETGKLKSVVDRRYSMENIAEAIRYVKQGHKKRNVVICPGVLSNQAGIDLIRYEEKPCKGFITKDDRMICYLLTPLAFYRLFSAVNKNLFILAVIFGITGTAIGMLHLLHEYAALHILITAEYQNGKDVQQLKTQAMIFLDLYEHGYVIAQISFTFRPCLKASMNQKQPRSAPRNTLDEAYAPVIPG